MRTLINISFSFVILFLLPPSSKKQQHCSSESPTTLSNSHFSHNIVYFKKN